MATYLNKIKLAETEYNISAWKLKNNKKIFNLDFDGTEDVRGQPLVFGQYVEEPSKRFWNSGIHIRENDLVADTKEDIGYAPSIGFHWSDKIAATMLFHNDGNFYLREQDGISRANLDANLIGNAETATKLATAKDIQVNLASSSAASFDGTAAIAPGVTGTLAVGNGGTGRTSLVTPTVTWTAGTSAGPTLEIKDSLNKTSSAVEIPSASSSASGIVTTGDQTFAGNKIFNASIFSSSNFISQTLDGVQGLKMWTDTEGGNIQIYPSSDNSAGTNFWAMDAYNGHFRWYCVLADETVKTGPYINASNCGIYGAVWNDYAEFRTQKEIIEPGYCVASADNGKVYKTTEKFQACDGIVSDTFGFAIGETDECKTPLAVAGRVLAYFHGNREDYHAGDTVCAGPEGKVMRMTREEIKEYPDRIIGIVSEIPEYEIWGSGNITVNNRIWIKIK